MMKKITAFFCCIMLLCAIPIANCQALTLSEQYASCFEQDDLSGVTVETTTEEDKAALKTMIIAEGKELAKYLGPGAEIATPDELLETNENSIRLTIKDSSGKFIAGEVILSADLLENYLNVGYWIGKDFRGKGYASSAVTKVISKVWQKDSNVSLVFVIENENIASIKTFEKVCKNLGIDPKITKMRTDTLELKLEKNKDNPKNYNIKIYLNGIFAGNKTVSEHRILETYSKDKIESGTLYKVQSTTYVINSKN